MCYKLKYLFALLLGTLLLLSFKNQAPKEAEAFLSLSCKEAIPIYKTASKQIVLKYLRHDFKEEDYLLFTIINSNDCMYYVEASSAIAGNNIRGWISKDVKIVTFSKSYNGKLAIYSSPDRKSNKTFLAYLSDELRVIDYRNGWLKVKIPDKEKNMVGWLPPEELCGNPYTTCS